MDFEHAYFNPVLYCTALQTNMNNKRKYFICQILQCAFIFQIMFPRFETQLIFWSFPPFLIFFLKNLQHLTFSPLLTLLILINKA